MKEQILLVLAAFLASILIMVLHEIPKVVIHHKNINPISFIDPVGLIFCVTSCCGFSKPYIYLGRDKKISKWSGVVGLGSLLLLFITSIMIARYGLRPMIGQMNLHTMKGSSLLFLYYTTQYMGVISFGMFITNLFPMAAFDMGQIIRGSSDHIYFSILKGDYLIKIIYLITVILGIIKVFGVQCTMYLINS